MKAGLWALVAVALGATGCAEDIKLDFRIQSAPPGTAHFDSRSIDITEGLAVVAVAVPLEEDDDRLDWETSVELDTLNPQVLTVTRLEYPEDEEDRKEESRRNGDWYFTFAAASVGNTTLEYYVDGDFEGEITVRVIPQ